MNMKLRLTLMAIIFVGFMAWQSVTPSNNESNVKRYPDVPWNITYPTESTLKVLGVTLGKSNVEDVKVAFNSDHELGLYVDKNDNASLEAYFNSVKQAGLSAKVIVHLDLSNQPWQQWRDNQAKYKSMPNGEIKYSLSSDDFRQAETLPIKLMAYIPVVNLDEDVVNKRFGTNHDNYKISETVSYWLYPTKGMAIRFDSKGKEIITYAHPSNLVLLKKAIDEELAENKAK